MLLLRCKGVKLVTVSQTAMDELTLPHEIYDVTRQIASRPHSLLTKYCILNDVLKLILIFSEYYVSKQHDV